MKQALPAMAGLVLSSAAVSPAFTQTFDTSPQSGARVSAQTDGARGRAFEIEHELDADMLLALGGETAPQSPPYGDVRYRVTAETVRADGLRWGGRLELGAVRHDGGRGVGGAIACPLDCPAQGLVTGLFAGPGPGAAEARADFARAEVFFRHPYAQLRAGITDTAAALERPSAVRALRLAGADGALADPFDRNIADTGLSLTSPALGVSLQSRRIAGLRAAVSYTGDADPCGLDHCRIGQGLAPDVGPVWSAAVGFDRRSRASGVRWTAYAGGESGAIKGAAAGGYADPWAANLALVREAGAVTLSARWLRSNDGLGAGRYEAAAVGAAFEAGDWLVSAEAGSGDSAAFDTRSATLFIGASRFVGRNGLAGAGVQVTRADAGAVAPSTEAALLLEAGLRF
jgi:hypothetical protein